LQLQRGKLHNICHTHNPLKEDIKKSTTVTPSGSITLDNCKVVYAQEKAQKEFAFEVITPGRRYLLSASNAEEMREWVNVLAAISGDAPPLPPGSSISAEVTPTLLPPPPTVTVFEEEPAPQAKKQPTSSRSSMVVPQTRVEEEELEYPDSGRTTYTKPNSSESR
jgi:hypothetical protein